MAQDGTNLAIARLEQGDRQRTARHAAVMNEIIDGVNKLLGLKVARSGVGDGKMLQADANLVLDLGDVGGRIDVAVDDTDDFPEGEIEVDNITRITFDSALFKIHDNGGSEVIVTLLTETCGDIDGGAA